MEATQREQTWLSGPRGSIVTVKPGDQIYWINPRLAPSSAGEASAQEMISRYGGGPFVIKRITYYRAGMTRLAFDDQNGDEQEINVGYFTG